MTPKQQHTLANERTDGVGFPPAWEMTDGSMRVMVAVAFSGHHGGPPQSLDFEVLDVMPDGTIRSRHGHRYHLET